MNNALSSRCIFGPRRLVVFIKCCQICRSADCNTARLYMRVYNARAATNHRAALVHVTLVHDAVIVDVISSKWGNSPDKLRHTRSVAYLVELFVPNKHQISVAELYLDCYLVQTSLCKKKLFVYYLSCTLCSKNITLLLIIEKRCTGGHSDGIPTEIGTLWRKMRQNWCWAFWGTN